MASRVLSCASRSGAARCRPWRMVPKAPRMSPTWASSRTAVSTGSVILTLTSWFVSSPRAAQERTFRRSGGQVSRARGDGVLMGQGGKGSRPGRLSDASGPTRAVDQLVLLSWAAERGVEGHGGPCLRQSTQVTCIRLQAKALRHRGIALAVYACQPEKCLQSAICAIAARATSGLERPRRGDCARCKPPYSERGPGAERTTRLRRRHDGEPPRRRGRRRG